MIADRKAVALETGENTELPRYRLLYLIKRVSTATKLALESMTRPEGIAASEFTMLSFLRRMEPCSIADLARAQKVTPQAATQQVAQLKAKGLVTSRENEVNRRILLISMTPLGAEKLSRVAVEARSLESEAMAGFTEEECATAIAFLQKLTVLAEERGQIDNAE